MLINVAIRPLNPKLPPLRAAVVWPDLPIATRELALQAVDQWQEQQAHMLPTGCRFDRSDVFVMSPDGAHLIELIRTITIVEDKPAIAA